MRHCNALCLIFLSLALYSCTPQPVLVSYFCDGAFITREATDNGFMGVTITSKTNVRDGASGHIVGGDTIGKDATALVQGTIDDVCTDGSISYNGPSGGVTVNLPRASLKATAPHVTYTGDDGKFTYGIAIDCCPNSAGRSHDVSIQASMSVAYARVNRTRVVCSDNRSITVDGQMATVGSGWVKVTIVSDRGRTCVLETTIARDH